MTDLFLDDLIDEMYDDEEEAVAKEGLGIGLHKMKIIKIKHNVNQNGTPYVSITSVKEDNYLTVPYYFTEKAKRKSLETLKKLFEKKVGKFEYEKPLTLDSLCNALEPLCGQQVTVEIFQNGNFQNYRIF